MARPPAVIVPPDPMLVVDRRTPFVCHSPVLLDAQGRPLVNRTVRLALCAAEDPATEIHNTLAGYGVGVGDGSYSLALVPYALWLRLADFANLRIYLVATAAQMVPVSLPLRVVWRADTYPVVPA